MHNAANDFKPCSSLLNLSEGVYGIDYANRSSKLAFGGAGGLYVLSLYSPWNCSVFDKYLFNILIYILII